MLVISKEAINSVMSLREKMTDPGKRAECVADVENMVRIKEAHLSRAESGSCCGDICNLVPQIDNELHMLQNILEVLREEDGTRAAPLLEDYIARLLESYRPEPNHW